MIGIYPKRDFVMLSGFLLFGGAHIAGFIVFGGLFWAVGFVLSLVLTLLYASGPFVKEDSWLGDTPFVKMRWFDNGFLVLLFGLLFLLRPGEFWQLVGALLVLGLLAGRVSFCVIDKKRLGR
jgi:hypothetical protein